MTAPTKAAMKLTDPTFPDRDKAFKWAFHVARTGQRKTAVRKIDGVWRVLATPMNSGYGEPTIDTSEGDA